MHLKWERGTGEGGDLKPSCPDNKPVPASPCAPASCFPLVSECSAFPKTVFLWGLKGKGRWYQCKSCSGVTLFSPAFGAAAHTDPGSGRRVGDGAENLPLSEITLRRGQGLTYSQTIFLRQHKIKCWSLLSHENPCADLMRGDSGEGRCPGSVPAGARL